MLRVKRVYEAPAKEDGYRVLVDRLWPRGVKKEKVRIGAWMKEIAPSEALRKWFGHDPRKWKKFERRYRAELAEKKELVAELKGLQKEHKTLTLVFGARDKEHNQAVALRNYLKGGRKR